MTSPLPLFVYGTLMWPDVLKAVIGRIPAMEDAILEGHRRLKIKNAIYPALIIAPSYTVKGKLIRGLSNKELLIIDDFEGDEYTRKEVMIKTATGNIEAAFVYIFNDDYLYLLKDEDWKPSELSEKVIKRFINDEPT